MKKTFLTLFLMTTMFGAAYADGREKPTSVDKLPQAAQEFLSAHFKDLTVAYAVEEQKYTGKEYEVVYTDRTEIEFRSDGQWESVGRKYSPVPASIVPQHRIHESSHRDSGLRQRCRRSWAAMDEDGRMYSALSTTAE